MMEEVMEAYETKSLLIINRDKVRKHWGKSEAEVVEILEEIKTWMKTQSLPEMLTDSMLEFFLTNNKYNVEKTKKNITKYYSIRKQVPEFFRGTHPRIPEMQEAWNMGVYFSLPQLQEGLYRVSIVNIYPNTSKFSSYKYYANMMNIYEIRICEDLCLNEICIVDYKELQWGHVFKMTPFVMHKLSLVIESLARSRVKAVHIIRAPYYINILVNLAKKFLKKKIGDRIMVHKSIEDVYEYVPREILPKDYGGDEKSLDELVELWKQKLEEYHDRFDMLQKFAEED